MTRYEQEEKKLQRFDTVKDAIEYAREHMDCSTAEKACCILKDTKKKFVAAQLQLCSFLHRKGYKEILGPFDISAVIRGEVKLEDVLYDTIEES